MALVQSASNTAASGTSVTVTLGSNTTAGNCIVVAIGDYNTGGTSPTVSSITLGGSSGSFAQAKGITSFGEGNCEIWTDQNCAGGQTSVVVNFSSAVSTAEVWVMEWSTIATSIAVDKTISGSGSNTSSFSSGSSGTLTQANEVIIGAVFARNASTETITGPGSPWTNLSGLSSASAYELLVGYQSVTATTAQTYSGTISASSSYTSVLITLTIASTGPVSVSGLVSQDTVAAQAAKTTISESLSIGVTVSAGTALTKVSQTESPSAVSMAAFGSTSDNINGLAASVSVKAPLFVDDTSRASVAAYFGAITVSAHITANVPVAAVIGSPKITFTSTITVNNSSASNYGLVKVSQSLLSSVSVSGNTIASNIKYAGSTSHVSVLANTGGISMPNTVYGYLAKVFAEVPVFSLSISKTLTSNSAAVSNTGIIKSFISGITSGVTSVANSSVPAIKVSLTSNTYIDAEYGKVGAGDTVSGTVSAVAGMSNFGTVKISPSITANVIASSTQRHAVSVTAPVARVSSASYILTLVVAPQATPNTSAASHMGSPSVTYFVKTSKAVSSSKIGTVNTGASVTAANTTASSTVSIRVSTGNSVSVNQSAITGSAKVAVTTSPSNVSAFAQKQGTNVGPIVAHCVAIAYSGSISVFYSVPAKTAVKSYYGLAGGSDIEAKLITRLNRY